jgi:hypothetical protein
MRETCVFGQNPHVFFLEAALDRVASASKEQDESE